MFSTQRVLLELRRENPQSRITEHRLRSAIRHGRAPAPTIVAGRYLWTLEEVEALAAALSVVAPISLQLESKHEGVDR